MTTLVATILAASYLGLFLVVFAETGLLLGFFLPGDSLLIPAGLLAVHGSPALPLVMLACTVGAVLGDSAGYWIGARLGERVWSRPGSRWLKPEFVEGTHVYFERYGAKTWVIARFIPSPRRRLGWGGCPMGLPHLQRPGWGAVGRGRTAGGGFAGQVGSPSGSIHPAANRGGSSGLTGLCGGGAAESQRIGRWALSRSFTPVSSADNTVPA